MADLPEDEQDGATDASAAARLLGALGRAAGELGGGEAIGDLGGRARAIVEELARTARARAAEADARRRRAGSSPRADEDPARDQGQAFARGGAGPAELAAWTAGLAAAAASIDTLAETLDATLERLERIEDVLGDPEPGRAGDMTAALARCERSLDGLVRTMRGLAPAGPDAAPSSRRDASSSPAVLVVSGSSARRARLVVALEKQGLRVRAASGLTAAMAAGRADAAVLAVEPIDTGFAGMLEDWKEHQDAGNLPPAVVVTAAGRDRVLGAGLPVVGDDEGAAALAEALEREARRAADQRKTATEENR